MRAQELGGSRHPAGRTVNPVYIIAEAGVNHNGDLGMAMNLVRVAAECGADAVKFQTFNAAGLVSKSAKKADYQERATGSGESQFEMLRKLELDLEAHRALLDECRARKIEFLSTPFDSGSIALLRDLGMQTFKIPSGEITNLPYLREVAKVAKSAILSTGMSDLGEVENALAVLEKAGLGPGKVTILHATTEYPAPMGEVNLLAMVTLAQAFKVPVGYSDHTPGIEIPIAATALGARVIEKHFTLDRSLPGPDHKASLEPHELAAMVRAIRNVTAALGDGRKRATSSEIKNMAVARKSIVARRPIRKGEPFTEENLACKRPGTGISPMRWDEILGKPSPSDFAEDDRVAL